MKSLLNSGNILPVQLLLLTFFYAILIQKCQNQIVPKIERCSCRIWNLYRGNRSSATRSKCGKLKNETEILFVFVVSFPVIRRRLSIDDTAFPNWNSTTIFPEETLFSIIIKITTLLWSSTVLWFWWWNTYSFFFRDVDTFQFGRGGGIPSIESRTAGMKNCSVKNLKRSFVFVNNRLQYSYIQSEIITINSLNWSSDLFVSFVIFSG